MKQMHTQSLRLRTRGRVTLLLLATLCIVTGMADAQQPEPDGVALLGGDDFIWQSVFHGPGMDDDVNASVVWDDGSGPALYVGGRFEIAGDQVVNGVARWDGDGWAALGGASGIGVTGGSNIVDALVVYEGDLYVAGSFSSAGGVAVNNIARWDGSAWSAVAGTAGQGLDGRVHALTVHDGVLYAGGSFSHAGGHSANRVARWDGAEWSPLGSGVLGTVDALASFDGELIIAGGFFQAGGQSISNIARWDGAQWHPLAEGMESIPGGHVFALAAHDDVLIAAGTFGVAGDLEVNNIARWDGKVWSALGDGFAPEVSGVPVNVYSLEIYQGELIAGGEFARSGDTTVNGIARWDGGQWHALSDPGGIGVDGTLQAGVARVRTLAVFGGQLVTGGEFATAGGSAGNNIARWDGSFWHALEDASSSGLNDLVFATALYNGTLVVGGRFTGAGGTRVNSVARWDGAGWSPLTGAAGTGVAGEVSDMTIYDGDLIVGGDFSEAGGVVVNGVARWDGEEWSALSGPTGTGVTESSGNADRARVSSLHVQDGALFVGGDFIRAGGVIVNNIARWDGEQWSALGGGMSLPNSLVEALGEYQGDLFAGGQFLLAGGMTVNHIARWDGEAWFPVGGGVDDGGNVIGFAVHDGVLTAGGSFTHAGGVPGTSRVAGWDGSEWRALGSGMAGTGFVWVESLITFEGDLIAAGSFAQADGIVANNIARWNGSEWSSLAGPEGVGTAGTVLALQAIESDVPGLPANSIVAGGDFHFTGGRPNWNLGVYGPSQPLAVTPDPLVFGPVQTGEVRGPLEARLANTGAEPVTIDAISAPAAPFSTAGGDCPAPPFTLDPQDDCTLAFEFSPGAAGAFSTTLEIDTGAAAGAQTLVLRGTGTETPAHLAPNPAAFGAVVIGGTTQPQVVTLTNTGPDSLDVEAIETPAAPFTMAGGTCPAAPFELAGFADCTLVYAFSPTLAGDVSETVTVDAGGMQALTLEGVGADRVVEITPATLEFGDVALGTGSEMSLTLENPGQAAVNIYSTDEPEGDFERIGGSCGEALFSIAPQDECTVEYRFSPRQPGEATGSVEFTGNMPGGSADAMLSGNGVGPRISLAPNEVFVVVDEGDTADRIVDVVNQGNMDLTWEVAEAPAGADVVSHSEDLEIMAGLARVCAGATGMSENRFLRAFTLADFGIVTDFELSEVSFGVQTVIGEVPVTVNLYTLEGELLYDNLTEVGSVTETLGDQSESLVTFPVDAVVPGGTTLVMEVGVADLQGQQVAFFPGANNHGETAPSYFFAPGCDAAEPVPFADIGLPDVHLVMAVTGEAALCPLPDWLTVAPQNGEVAGSSVQSVELGFDSQGLVPGRHEAALCMASNDPIQPNAAASVELVVAFPEMELDVTELDFGLVFPNQMPSGEALVTNTGFSDLDIVEVIEPGAPFELSGGSCIPPAALTPGQSCSFEVSFDPSDAGSFVDSLEIISNADSSPDVVTLSAEAVAGIDKLVAAGGSDNDNFGVALARDADTLVVGADGTGIDGNNRQGAAYVYVRDGGGWSQQARLEADDGEAFDSFGSSVAVLGDIAVVGADRANVDGTNNQGAAYVFVREDDMWSLEQKLVLEDGASSDRFGDAVALMDGLVLIGAPSRNIGDNNNQGAVYVFARGEGGWVFETEITATDGMAIDFFGEALATDGDALLVGAERVNVDGNFNQGAAYVFTRDGDGWTEEAKLVAAGGEGGDFLGQSVALFGDIAVVGAPNTGSGENVNQGAAYVFSRGGGNWSEQASLTVSDISSSDNLGSAVAVWGDTVLVGRSGAGIAGNVNQGSAHLFVQENGTWVERELLIAPDGGGNDRFGAALVLDDELAIIGAPFADIAGVTGQGAVYLFSLIHAGEPQVALSPAALDFGTVPLGAAGEHQVEIANVGDADLELDEITSPGMPFALEDSGSCAPPQSLAPDESCTVVVSFVPDAVGEFDDTVAIHSNAASSPDALSLTGAAEDAEPAILEVEPGKLVFGTTEIGTSAEATVTVINTAPAGALALTLSEILLGGNPALEISGGDCASGVVLELGDTCLIEIRFSPVEAGVVAGVLEVHATDGQWVSVDVAGAGGETEPPDEIIFRDRFRQE